MTESNCQMATLNEMILDKMNLAKKKDIIDIKRRIFNLGRMEDTDKEESELEKECMKELNDDKKKFEQRKAQMEERQLFQFATPSLLTLKNGGSNQRHTANLSADYRNQDDAWAEYDSTRGRDAPNNRGLNR